MNKEYEHRYKYRSKQEIELSKKYNCDGLCYGHTFMCPGAEKCPQTAAEEGRATLFAIITVALIYGVIFLLPIIFAILVIIKVGVIK